MALVDTPLPRDDATVLYDGTVVHHIGPVSVDDFNAVSIEVHDSSIELIVATSGCRGTVGTGSSVQGCSVEVSNGRPTGSGECDVRGTGFHTISVVNCGVPVDRQSSLPRCFLADEEISIPDPEADLVSRLSDVAVAKWLQSSSEE
jgi:hypothetical protein